MSLPSVQMTPNPLGQPDHGALLSEAEAACARNDHRSGAALACAAIDRAAADRDEASAARARSVLAQVCVLTGEFDSAGRLARSALEHAAVHGPPSLLAQGRARGRSGQGPPPGLVGVVTGRGPHLDRPNADAIDRGFIRQPAPTRPARRSLVQADRNARRAGWAQRVG